MQCTSHHSSSIFCEADRVDYSFSKFGMQNHKFQKLSLLNFTGCKNNWYDLNNEIKFTVKPKKNIVIKFYHQDDWKFTVIDPHLLQTVNLLNYIMHKRAIDMKKINYYRMYCSLHRTHISPTSQRLSRF